MGFRFRKSVKVGGLRINFSKSGIGYSYGVKGLRYTKTAKGKERVTASIPGTGLSWTAESGGKRKSQQARNVEKSPESTTPKVKSQYTMPIVPNVLIGIASLGIGEYYYFSQGLKAEDAIVSGLILALIIYVVLYGVCGAILMSLGIGKEELIYDDKEPAEISEKEQEAIAQPKESVKANPQQPVVSAYPVEARAEERVSGRVERKSKGRSIVRIPKHYTVVDTETTGLDSQKNRLIEIAALRVRGGKVTARFETLVKPGRKLSRKIVELTGITDEELKDAPKPEKALAQFMEFLNDDIIVAHNANFDVNFIYDSLIRCEMPPLKNNFVDTLRLAKYIRPDLDDYKLSTLAKEYQIPQPTAHRALADCETTMAVLQKLGEDADKRWVDLSQYQKKGVYSSSKVSGIVAEPGHEKPESPFYGKRCVFTGELDSMTRREAAQLVVNIGGTCSDRINGKTNFLIAGQDEYHVGSDTSESTKILTAKDMMQQGADIQILTEETFLAMLAE